MPLTDPQIAEHLNAIFAEVVRFEADNVVFEVGKLPLADGLYPIGETPVDQPAIALITGFFQRAGTGVVSNGRQWVMSESSTTTVTLYGLQLTQPKFKENEFTRPSILTRTTRRVWSKIPYPFVSITILLVVGGVFAAAFVNRPDGFSFAESLNANFLLLAVPLIALVLVGATIFWLYSALFGVENRPPATETNSNNEPQVGFRDALNGSAFDRNHPHSTKAWAWITGAVAMLIAANVVYNAIQELNGFFGQRSSVTTQDQTTNFDQSDLNDPAAGTWLGLFGFHVAPTPESFEKFVNAQRRAVVALVPGMKPVAKCTRDLQKTDSLIAPYIGAWSSDYLAEFIHSVDEEPAIKVEFRFNITAEYGLVDGKWACQGVVSEITNLYASVIYTGKNKMTLKKATMLTDNANKLDRDYPASVFADVGETLDLARQVKDISEDRIQAASYMSIMKNLRGR